MTYVELSLFIPRLRARKTTALKPARCVRAIGPWPKASATAAISGSIPSGPALSPPPAPGAARTCCCGAGGHPPAKQWVRSSSAQKASVFGRAHYGMAQPCSSEPAPAPRPRNNADSYSHLPPTGVLLVFVHPCSERGLVAALIRDGDLLFAAAGKGLQRSASLVPTAGVYSIPVSEMAARLLALGWHISQNGQKLVCCRAFSMP